MRPRALGFILWASLALGSTAAAQTLPSTAVGPGYVPPLFASEGVQAVQFNVEVIGRAPDISGSATDQFLAFSAPIQIPGVGLPPGTYVFRLVHPSVVQVTSADRRTVYTMFTVTPITRLLPTTHHEVLLERTNNDAPMRLVGLFAPGAVTGYAPWFRPPSACERILRDLNLPTDACEGV